MTDQSTSERTSSDLERDAERVRAQIADTAEHLKDKMSPGQLMDEVVNYFKDGDTNQLLSNLKTQVRDNPMALAMVGGGLAWLMMGSGPSAAKTHQTATSYRATPPPMTPRSTVGSYPDGTGSTSAASTHSSSHGSTLGKGAEAMKSKSASAASSIGEAASSATDAVSAKAHDMRDAAGHYLSSASHAGANAGTRVQNAFLDVLEREPLVLGALGVAVGAAIGAMLPATRTEQEYLGAASHRARDAAETALHDGVDKAKHVASDVYAAAKDEADRQGLTGDKPIASKMADVARAAGGELKSASDESMKQAGQTADRTTDKMTPAKDRPV